MNVRQTKQAVRDWVELNAGRWPGLRAAHLVGGITAMPDDAPFPAGKDVDVHLIFAGDSLMLERTSPWSGILEEEHCGLAIEAGVKPLSDYDSPEAVLGNPEIAYHLTVDSVLYDPYGLLRDLHPAVRRDYPKRQWVTARLEHERRGLAEALAMQSMARATLGASGEVNLLGYSTTFATAALQVAALEPPRMGGRTVLRLRDGLAAHCRLDLHEEVLEILGLSRIAPDQVARLLDEAAEGFDLALTIEAAPGPFQHKLRPHLRSYLTGPSREMLDGGCHREAMGWVTPYHLATADVILGYGPAALKPVYAARQANLLRSLGLDTVEARDSALARLTRVWDQVFALCEATIASHPGVVA